MLEVENIILNKVVKKLTPSIKSIKMKEANPVDHSLLQKDGWATSAMEYVIMIEMDDKYSKLDKKNRYDFRKMVRRMIEDYVLSDSVEKLGSYYDVGLIFISDVRIETTWA